MLFEDWSLIPGPEPLDKPRMSFEVYEKIAEYPMHKIWAAILVAIGILFFSMAVTMFVHEEPLREPPGPLDWTPLGRLVAMTLVFLVVILSLGEIIQAIGKLLSDVSAVPTLLIVMGGTGLLAMVVAVVILT